MLRMGKHLKGFARTSQEAGTPVKVRQEVQAAVSFLLGFSYGRKR